MNLAVIGLQFGDEGKGKIVDYLAKDFDIVARFSGGSNAGHTVVFDGRRIRFHLIPSGVLRGKTGVLGNGMVINMEKLKEEVEKIRELGIRERIIISSRAHVATRIHEMIDENEDKIINIGTTKQGIGPAYTSKVRRIGIRIIDLFHEEVLRRKLKVLFRFSGLKFDAKLMENEIEKNMKIVREFRDSIVDTEIWLNNAMNSGKSVLFEGSQGTFLDIDFGFYPYVTSTSTTVGGIVSGLGISPRRIDRVLGVAKAYTTRVGGGPFPTEISGEEAERIRRRGNEYGATTGRPRRVGYPDLVLLRYSAMLNDVDYIALTKVDVLTGMQKIPVATSYDCDGVEYQYPAPTLRNCKPKYEFVNGWKDDSIENYRKFAEYMERKLGRKIKIISFGDKRDDTVEL